jgi:hypothetical protein
MNDPVGMQELKSIDNLEGVAFNFKLMQSLSSLQKFIKRVV